MIMEHVEKHYEKMTIRCVGKNDFGYVFAVYSKSIERVFADICKDKSGKYVLRMYDSYSVTKDAVKIIGDFMDYAEQLESPLDCVEPIKEQLA